MEKEFWIDRWNNNQIGFHQPTYHHYLVKYFTKLNLQKNDQVLIPLCGKTLDIEFFLQKGISVIGCELAELAVKELFENLKVTPIISSKDNFKIYSYDKLKIFVGDFFELNANDLGKINGIYDRAAIVALPEKMRENYTQHLRQITHNAPQLLITFDYDQSKIAGPPFAVSANEVKNHYQAIYKTELLETIDLEKGMKGVTAATENAWFLSSK